MPTCTNLNYLQTQRKMNFSLERSAVDELPGDCLMVIASFLPLQGIQAMRGVNKNWRSLLVEDKTLLLVDMFSDMFVSKCSDEDRCPIKVNVSGQDCWKLMTWITRCFQRQAIHNLQHSVKLVSSVDRWQESGDNLIDTREINHNHVGNKCYKRISNSENPFVGIRLQIACQCASSRPCYWSSLGSEDGESCLEHVVIQAKHPVCLITGFAVRPYRALWHPSHPTYGPRYVAIEFIYPRAATLPYPPIPSSTNRVNSYTVNSSEISRDVVYFRSPFYPVQNTNSLQMFFLESPQLLVGGMVRMVFRGKHQQQTMGDDDYYLCLNPGKLFGIPLPAKAIFSSLPSETHSRNEVGVELSYSSSAIPWQDPQHLLAMPEDAPGFGRSIIPGYCTLEFPSGTVGQALAAAEILDKDDTVEETGCSVL